MAAKGWQREFDDPILLPDGIQLKTLRDAISYLARTIPKSERDMPAVTTAAETLTYAAERGWPTMLAPIGVLRALNRHVERVFNPDRKDTHWAKRKLKRDGNSDLIPCSRPPVALGWKDR
jgi:hypothetical protein